MEKPGIFLQDRQNQKADSKNKASENLPYFLPRYLPEDNHDFNIFKSNALFRNSNKDPAY